MTSNIWQFTKTFQDTPSTQQLFTKTYILTRTNNNSKKKFRLAGHLAVRTVLVAGRDHLLSLRGSIKTGGPPASSKDPYSRVLLLQHHLDRMPAEEQFQYALSAALLVTLLARLTSFLTPERVIPGLPGRLRPVQPGGEVPDATVHFLGSLILRHIVQLVANAHAVTELLEDEEAGTVEQVK